jgi:hypothetical protein
MASRQEIAGLYASLQLETAQFKQALGEATKSTRDFSRMMRAETTEAKHAIHMLSESIGAEIPRALQGVLAKVPLVTTAMSAMFPVAAVLLFAKAAFENFEKIEEHFKKQEEAAKKAQEAWGELATSTGSVRMELEKANRTIESSIAALTKKQSQNGLKNALLDAADAAEQLSKKLDTDIDKMLKLQGQEKKGWIDRLLGSSSGSDLSGVRQSVTSALSQVSGINAEYDDVMQRAAASGNKKNVVAQQQLRENALTKALAPAANQLYEWLRAHQGEKSQDAAWASSAWQTVSNVMQTSHAEIENTSGSLSLHDAKDDKARSDAAKEVATKAAKAQEAAIKVLENKLNAQQAEFNLGPGISQMFWEHVKGSRKWGNAATENLDSKISAATQQFNAQITGKISAMHKQMLSELAPEPAAGWKPITQGLDQLARAQEEAATTAAKNKAARDAATLGYDLAAGSITQYAYAVKLAEQHDAEYVAQRKALSEQLEKLQKFDGLFGSEVIDPENESKKINVRTKIDELSNSHKLQADADKLSESYATLHGQIDLVFDEMRRKSQETYKGLAQDLQQFVGGMNSATANAMTGHGSRKDFASVFEGSAHSLASQSLEKVEGLFLGKGKKRDGSATDARLFTESIITNFDALRAAMAYDAASSKDVANGQLLGPGLAGVPGDSTGADVLGSVVGSVGKSAGGKSSSMGTTAGSAAMKSVGRSLTGWLNDSDTASNLLGGHLFGSNSVFGGFRAAGGEVLADTPYIVGERGPELMIPGTSGSIVPNHQLASMGGSPVYNVDARGTDAAMVHQAVYRGMTMAHAQAVTDSNRNMRDSVRRTPR